MPHTLLGAESVIFTFTLVRSISELGWARGQDVTFTPHGEYSNFQLVTHMPKREDGFYAEHMIKHWTRLRQIGQHPSASALSALDYLKMRVRTQRSA
jgi:hypothetical protein